MENLILFCGNKAQSDERIMNILEIVVLMLREQVCSWDRFETTKKKLVIDRSSQRKNWPLPANSKQKINDRRIRSECLAMHCNSSSPLADRLQSPRSGLRTRISRETAIAKTNRKVRELIGVENYSMSPSRSTFGGATYVMSNAKGIGENQLICHRPLQSLNTVEFDREKRRLRRPKNRAPVKNELDESQLHQSALGIRLFLREFCLAFLDNCYNVLMPRARVRLKQRLTSRQSFIGGIRK